MDLRVGLSFLLLLAISYVYCDARNLETSDVSVSDVIPGHETDYLKEYERNRRMCVLCEQFAGQAMEYLKENRTQSEIMETFHHVCFRLHSFQQQCMMLVDYYAPLLFLEVALVRPHDFCRKVSLCDDMAPPPPPPPTSPPPPASPPSPSPPSPSPSPVMDPLAGERICTICNNTVYNFLARLKDPGTELKIVEGLVKGCVMTENFAQKCQNLIFQYGPVILTSAVRILEKADLCVALHACSPDRNETAVSYASPLYLTSLDM